jgi:hypothetical protein
MRAVFTIAFILLCFCVFGQNSIEFIIRDSGNQSPLAAATVTLSDPKRSATTGTEGLVQISDIPDGKKHFVITHVGFCSQRDCIRFSSVQRS